jgi:type VI secretion system protein ImpF
VANCAVERIGRGSSDHEGEMMAAVSSETRLSPPLMHVFRAAHEAKDAKKKVDIRNEAGDRIIAGRRLRARQVITESVLRREVSRDLEALLNTVAMESTIDMTETPYARKSIINFGIPDISNRTIDENAVNSIPAEIKAAIINYEPRLAAASLDVERDTNVDAVELKVRFIVRADLTCDPVHVPVEFIADIVETGRIMINRL